MYYGQNAPIFNGNFADGVLFVLPISIVWFAKFLLYEPKKKCVVFISFSHSHKSPYILKVIANLIKEYFSSSRSVYISVLLCSVLLLATFTVPWCVFSVYLKHTALQVCLCPDIYDGADYVLQVHAVALLLCHDHNQAFHLFRQWCKILLNFFLTNILHKKFWYIWFLEYFSIFGKINM